MRDSRYNDPYDVEETLIDRDTVVLGDSPLILYSHPLGLYTFVFLTTRVLLTSGDYRRGRLSWDDVDVRRPLSHSLGDTQTLDNITGVLQRFSVGCDLSPKFYRLLLESVKPVTVRRRPYNPRFCEGELKRCVTVQGDQRIG